MIRLPAMVMDSRRASLLIGCFFSIVSGAGAITSDSAGPAPMDIIGSSGLGIETRLVRGEGGGPELAVESTRAAWAFYYAAEDKAGHSLRTTVAGRRVISPSTLRESVRIELPIAALRAHASAGWTVRLRGKRAEMIVRLTGAEIRDFLSKR